WAKIRVSIVQIILIKSSGARFSSAGGVVCRRIFTHILQRLSVHLTLRIHMESGRNELVEQGLECGDDSVASCTDQDANAAHDWNVMGYRQMAYCVVIREEYGVLFDGEGDHHHIDDGDGGGDECCIADLFEDMRLG